MLVEDVANCIEKYLSGHKNRSLRTLERRSGVSYSTIRRLAQKEVADPSIERTIIPVLSVFMGMEEIKDLLKRNDCHMSDILTSVDGYSVWEESPVLQDIDQVIILSARRRNGTTREKIIEDHGKVTGGERLDYLIRLDILRERGGRVFADDRYIPGPRQVMEEIETSARNFTFENVGKGAYYSNYTGSMAKPDYDHIRQLGLEYVQAISRAIKDPKPGEEVLVNLNIFGDFNTIED